MRVKNNVDKLISIVDYHLEPPDLSEIKIDEADSVQKQFLHSINDSYEKFRALLDLVNKFNASQVEQKSKNTSEKKRDVGLAYAEIEKQQRALSYIMENDRIHLEDELYLKTKEKARPLVALLIISKSQFAIHEYINKRDDLLKQLLTNCVAEELKHWRSKATQTPLPKQATTSTQSESQEHEKSSQSFFQSAYSHYKNCPASGLDTVKKVQEYKACLSLLARMEILEKENNIPEKLPSDVESWEKFKEQIKSALIKIYKEMMGNDDRDSFDKEYARINAMCYPECELEKHRLYLTYLEQYASPKVSDKTRAMPLLLALIDKLSTEHKKRIIKYNNFLKAEKQNQKKQNKTAQNNKPSENAEAQDRAAQEAKDQATQQELEQKRCKALIKMKLIIFETSGTNKTEASLHLQVFLALYKDQFNDRYPLTAIQRQEINNWVDSPASSKETSKAIAHWVVVRLGITENTAQLQQTTNLLEQAQQAELMGKHFEDQYRLAKENWLFLQEETWGNYWKKLDYHFIGNAIKKYEAAKNKKIIDQEQLKKAKRILFKRLEYFKEKYQFLPKSYELYYLSLKREGEKTAERAADFDFVGEEKDRHFEAVNSINNAQQRLREFQVQIFKMGKYSLLSPPNLAIVSKLFDSLKAFCLQALQGFAEIQEMIRGKIPDADTRLLQAEISKYTALKANILEKEGELIQTMRKHLLNITKEEKEHSDPVQNVTDQLIAMGEIYRDIDASDSPEGIPCYLEQPNNNTRMISSSYSLVTALDETSPGGVELLRTVDGDHIDVNPFQAFINFVAQHDNGDGQKEIAEFFAGDDWPIDLIYNGEHRCYIPKDCQLNDTLSQEAKNYIQRYSNILVALNIHFRNIKLLERLTKSDFTVFLNHPIFQRCLTSVYEIKRLKEKLTGIVSEVNKNKSKLQFWASSHLKLIQTINKQAFHLFDTAEAPRNIIDYIIQQVSGFLEDVFSEKTFILPISAIQFHSLPEFLEGLGKEGEKAALEFKQKFNFAKFFREQLRKNRQKYIINTPFDVTDEYIKLFNMCFRYAVNRGQRNAILYFHKLLTQGTSQFDKTPYDDNKLRQVKNYYGSWNGTNAEELPVNSEFSNLMKHAEELCSFDFSVNAAVWCNQFVADFVSFRAASTSNLLRVLNIDVKRKQLAETAKNKEIVGLYCFLFKEGLQIQGQPIRYKINGNFILDFESCIKLLDHLNWLANEVKIESAIDAFKQIHSLIAVHLSGGSVLPKSYFEILVKIKQYYEDENYVESEKRIVWKYAVNRLTQWLSTEEDLSPEDISLFKCVNSDKNFTDFLSEKITSALGADNQGEIQQLAFFIFATGSGSKQQKREFCERCKNSNEFEHYYKAVKLYGSDAERAEVLGKYLERLSGNGNNNFIDNVNEMLRFADDPKELLKSFQDNWLFEKYAPLKDRNKDKDKDEKDEDVVPIYVIKIALVFGDIDQRAFAVARHLRDSMKQRDQDLNLLLKIETNHAYESDTYKTMPCDLAEFEERVWEILLKKIEMSPDGDLGWAYQSVLKKPSKEACVNVMMALVQQPLHTSKTCIDFTHRLEELSSKLDSADGLEVYRDLQSRLLEIMDSTRSKKMSKQVEGKYHFEFGRLAEKIFDELKDESDQTLIDKTRKSIIQNLLNGEDAALISDYVDNLKSNPNKKKWFVQWTPAIREILKKRIHVDLPKSVEEFNQIVEEWRQNSPIDSLLFVYSPELKKWKAYWNRRDILETEISEDSVFAKELNKAHQGELSSAFKENILHLFNTYSLFEGQATTPQNIWYPARQKLATEMTSILSEQKFDVNSDEEQACEQQKVDFATVARKEYAKWFVAISSSADEFTRVEGSKKVSELHQQNFKLLHDRIIDTPGDLNLDSFNDHFGRENSQEVRSSLISFLEKYEASSLALKNESKREEFQSPKNGKTKSTQEMDHAQSPLKSPLRINGSPFKSPLSSPLATPRKGNLEIPPPIPTTVPLFIIETSKQDHNCLPHAFAIWLISQIQKDTHDRTRSFCMQMVLGGLGISKNEIQNFITTVRANPQYQILELGKKLRSLFANYFSENKLPQLKESIYQHLESEYERFIKAESDNFSPSLTTFAGMTFLGERFNEKDLSTLRREYKSLNNPHGGNDKKNQRLKKIEEQWKKILKKWWDKKGYLLYAEKLGTAGVYLGQEFLAFISHFFGLNIHYYDQQASGSQLIRLVENKVYSVKEKDTIIPNCEAPIFMAHFDHVNHWSAVLPENYFNQVNEKINSPANKLKKERDLKLFDPNQPAETQGLDAKNNSDVTTRQEFPKEKEAVKYPLDDLFKIVKKSKGFLLQHTSNEVDNTPSNVKTKSTPPKKTSGGDGRKGINNSPLMRSRKSSREWAMEQKIAEEKQKIDKLNKYYGEDIDFQEQLHGVVQKLDRFLRDASEDKEILNDIEGQKNLLLKLVPNLNLSPDAIKNYLKPQASHLRTISVLEVMVDQWIAAITMNDNQDNTLRKHIESQSLKLESLISNCKSNLPKTYGIFERKSITLHEFKEFLNEKILESQRTNEYYFFKKLLCEFESDEDEKDEDKKDKSIENFKAYVGKEFTKLLALIPDEHCDETTAREIIAVQRENYYKLYRFDKTNQAVTNRLELFIKESIRNKDYSNFDKVKKIIEISAKSTRNIILQEFIEKLTLELKVEALFANLKTEMTKLKDDNETKDFRREDNFPISINWEQLVFLSFGLEAKKKRELQKLVGQRLSQIAIMIIKEHFVLTEIPEENIRITKERDSLIEECQHEPENALNIIQSEIIDESTPTCEVLDCIYKLLKDVPDTHSSLPDYQNIEEYHSIKTLMNDYSASSIAALSSKEGENSITRVTCQMLAFIRGSVARKESRSSTKNGRRHSSVMAEPSILFFENFMDITATRLNVSNIDCKAGISYPAHVQFIHSVISWHKHRLLDLKLTLFAIQLGYIRFYLDYHFPKDKDFDKNFGLLDQEFVKCNKLVNFEPQKIMGAIATAIEPLNQVLALAATKFSKKHQNQISEQLINMAKPFEHFAGYTLPPPTPRGRASVAQWRKNSVYGEGASSRNLATPNAKDAGKASIISDSNFSINS